MSMAKKGSMRDEGRTEQDVRNLRLDANTPAHQILKQVVDWMSSLVTDLMPSGGDLLDDHATPGYSRLTAAH